MKRRLLGTYEIGYEKCRLFASEGYQGSFHFLPEDSPIPEIVVGIEDEKWWKTMMILQHEAFEFAMTRKGCRYNPNQDMGDAHSSYLFVMDHTQFSDVCGLATDFVSSCQYDLRKAWGKRKVWFPCKKV